jgi:hypothetical protein
MAEGVGLMARRKSGKKRGVAAPASRRIVVQASEEWIAWVEEGADFCRTDVSKLVDVALFQYLKSQGFEKIPPKRIL